MKPLLLLTSLCLILMPAAFAQKAKGKGKDKPKRPQEVGPVIGENKATPLSRIKVAKDFKVELLYSVPGVEQGSWVNMCEDPKGRLYEGVASTALRTVQIVLNRFDGCDDTQRQALIGKLDPLFPAATPEQNWLLCETLVYLQSPTVAAKGMTLIAYAPTQEEQMEFSRSLRMLKTGWTKELRTQQLEWFLKAANYRGGASFDQFIQFIRTDALATFTEAEKTQLAALIEKKPERKSAIENLGAMFVGRTPTNWTLEELSKAAETGLKNRSFDNRNPFCPLRGGIR